MSMNIQRFHAPTAREAMALARATFGDGTLILSNRQLGDGVEVVAAAEADLAALDASPSLNLAPAVPRAISLRGELPPAPAPVPDSPPANQAPAKAAAQPGASTREVVQADTEQLSMSTLSFQDYVRERMLRRQHEASTAAAAPSAAAVPARAETPRAPAAVAPRQQAVAASARPEALAEEAPVHAAALPALRIAPQAPIDNIPIEAQAPVPAPVPVLPSDMTNSVMAELHAMKSLMEERFNTLAWLGQARQDPIHSNLMLKLVRAGYSPALARSVLEPIAIGPDANIAVRAVMASLESRITTDAGNPSMVEEGGVFALIGATGVGKTTTIAKLATQGAQMYGASGVGLITLDTHRAGAHEQLRSYGRNLALVAHLAHDRAELHEMLALLSGKKLVLIDTAGIAPRDPRRRDLLDLLDAPSIKRVLVLNAGAHGDTLDEMATSFKIVGPGQAILSKVDEAAKLGPALDTLMRHELVLRGVANGQRIPQDWKVAHGGELVRESMRSAERSPFDPRTADMDFFFSPAACAA